MSNKIVLIDGHSILNRAFYGVPTLTNAKGMHTNAVYGFLNILFKILDEEKADRLIVAFDLSAPTFRHKMYKAYKGTRKPMPQELREQVPMIKEVLKAMNILVIEKEGYEADDILGTIGHYCEEQGYEVATVSGDRDLLQLATEHVMIRIPKTKKTGTEVENYLAADVVDTYGVTPTEFIDLKALMGDASDNIPGVPGIGEKTAAAIIKTYKSVENAYEHVEELKPARASKNLKEYYDQALLSKTLATIDIHVPIDVDLEKAAIDQMYNEASYEMFKQLSFKNMLSRFEGTSSEHNDDYKAIYIQDFGEAEDFFSRIPKAAAVGIAFISEGNFEGLSIAFSKADIAFILVEGFVTRAYLEDQVKDLVKKGCSLVTLNLKPQLKSFYIPETDGCFDAALAAYLLNPLESTYDYESMARDYLSITVPSKKELLGKQSMQKAFDEGLEELKTYLGLESVIALLTYDLIKGKLEEEAMMDLYTQIEFPLLYTLYRMEKEGIAVKAEELEVYGSELEGKIKTLEENIWSLAGENFNINSPKQLGVILFEKMHLPFAKKTKTGYSTSADVLEKLRGEDPIIGMILEYRQLTKLKSTYADGLATYINPADGRIHGTFNQTITATGRISSTEPNLQNIPVRMELGRLIRKVFVPKDGFVFLDSDYSQIELRVLAHMSGDEQLISNYKEAKDVHQMTASQVFHVPMDEVTPQLRRNAKAVNFGIVYGISSFGLSQDLSITRKEAEGYIKKYFETYPKVKEFLDKLVDDARTSGHVTTLFGRIRPIPELKASNFMQRSFGERIAMNSPIQGTAADIIKIAMIRVDHKLMEMGLKSRLILQVHDELLIETAKDEVDIVNEILRTEMTNAADLLVPLEIDTNMGDNWYEAK